MAKKKTSQKKHKFKHVDPEVSAIEVPEARPQSGAAVTSRPSSAVAQPATVSAGSAYAYVGSDMRRTAVLTALLVGLEFVLYYVLVHTAFGDTIYSLIQV